MTRPPRPGAGYVVLPLADYLALRDAATPAPRPAGHSWAVLSAVVALLTAATSGTPISPADLTDDIPAEAITATTVSVLASVLTACTPDRGRAMLTDLGMLAATREDGQ